MYASSSEILDFDYCCNDKTDAQPSYSFYPPFTHQHNNPYIYCSFCGRVKRKWKNKGKKQEEDKKGNPLDIAYEWYRKERETKKDSVWPLSKHDEADDFNCWLGSKYSEYLRDNDWNRVSQDEGRKRVSIARPSVSEDQRDKDTTLVQSRTPSDSNYSASPTKDMSETRVDEALNEDNTVGTQYAPPEIPEEQNTEDLSYTPTKDLSFETRVDEALILDKNTVGTQYALSEISQVENTKHMEFETDLKPCKCPRKKNIGTYTNDESQPVKQRKMETKAVNVNKSMDIKEQNKEKETGTKRKIPLPKIRSDVTKSTKTVTSEEQPAQTNASENSSVTSVQIVKTITRYEHTYDQPVFVEEPPPITTRVYKPRPSDGSPKQTTINDYSFRNQTNSRKNPPMQVEEKVLSNNYLPANTGTSTNISETSLLADLRYKDHQYYGQMEPEFVNRENVKHLPKVEKNTKHEYVNRKRLSAENREIQTNPIERTKPVAKPRSLIFDEGNKIMDSNYVYRKIDDYKQTAPNTGINSETCSVTTETSCQKLTEYGHAYNKDVRNGLQDYLYVQKRPSSCYDQSRSIYLKEHITPKLSCCPCPSSKHENNQTVTQYSPKRISITTTRASDVSEANPDINQMRYPKRTENRRVSETIKPTTTRQNQRTSVNGKRDSTSMPRRDSNGQNKNVVSTSQRSITPRQSADKKEGTIIDSLVEKKLETKDARKMTQDIRSISFPSMQGNLDKLQSVTEHSDVTASASVTSYTDSAPRKPVTISNFKIPVFGDNIIPKVHSCRLFDPPPPRPLGASSTKLSRTLSSRLSWRTPSSNFKLAPTTVIDSLELMNKKARDAKNAVPSARRIQTVLETDFKSCVCPPTNENKHEKEQRQNLPKVTYGIPTQIIENKYKPNSVENLIEKQFAVRSDSTSKNIVSSTPPVTKVESFNTKLVSNIISPTRHDAPNMDDSSNDGNKLLHQIEEHIPEFLPDGARQSIPNTLPVPKDQGHHRTRKISQQTDPPIQEKRPSVNKNQPGILFNSVPVDNFGEKVGRLSFTNTVPTPIEQGHHRNRKTSQQTDQPIQEKRPSEQTDDPGLLFDSVPLDNYSEKKRRRSSTNSVPTPIDQAHHRARKHSQQTDPPVQEKRPSVQRDDPDLPFNSFPVDNYGEHTTHNNSLPTPIEETHRRPRKTSQQTDPPVQEKRPSVHRDDPGVPIDTDTGGSYGEKEGRLSFTDAVSTPIDQAHRRQRKNSQRTDPPVQEKRPSVHIDDPGLLFDSVPVVKYSEKERRRSSANTVPTQIDQAHHKTRIISQQTDPPVVEKRSSVHKDDPGVLIDTDTGGSYGEKEGRLSFTEPVSPLIDQTHRRQRKISQLTDSPVQEKRPSVHGDDPGVFIDTDKGGSHGEKEGRLSFTNSLPTPIEETHRRPRKISQQTDPPIQEKRPSIHRDDPSVLLDTDTGGSHSEKEGRLSFTNSLPTPMEETHRRPRKISQQTDPPVQEKRPSVHRDDPGVLIDTDTGGSYGEKEGRLSFIDTVPTPIEQGQHRIKKKSEQTDSPVQEKRPSVHRDDLDFPFDSVPVDNYSVKEERLSFTDTVSTPIDHHRPRITSQQPDPPVVEKRSSVHKDDSDIFFDSVTYDNYSEKQYEAITETRKTVSKTELEESPMRKTNSYAVVTYSDVSETTSVSSNRVISKDHIQKKGLIPSILKVTEFGQESQLGWCGCTMDDDIDSVNSDNLHISSKKRGKSRSKIIIPHGLGEDRIYPKVHSCIDIIQPPKEEKKLYKPSSTRSSSTSWKGSASSTSLSYKDANKSDYSNLNNTEKDRKKKKGSKEKIKKSDEVKNKPFPAIASEGYLRKTNAKPSTSSFKINTKPTQSVLSTRSSLSQMDIDRAIAASRNELIQALKSICTCRQQPTRPHKMTDTVQTSDVSVNLSDVINEATFVKVIQRHNKHADSENTE